MEAALGRQEAIRRKNEPPHLTAGEEVVNTFTHGVGAGLAVAGFVLLLLRAQSALQYLATFVYGLSMMGMMTASAIYHAMPCGSRRKRVCRRLDYSSIYLLIGGTFAPIFLVFLGGRLGIGLFCLQWAVIALGVTLVAVFGPGRWRWLHFTLYFLLGWSGLAFLPTLYRYSPSLLAMIFLGGLAYTLGMIPFAQKKKYSHCVWHFFVLAGALLHWLGIYSYLY